MILGLIGYVLRAAALVHREPERSELRVVARELIRLDRPRPEQAAS